MNEIVIQWLFHQRMHALQSRLAAGGARLPHISWTEEELGMSRGAKTKSKW
jgi:hypothetical protein